MNNKGLISNTIIIISMLAFVAIVSLSSLLITQFYTYNEIIPTNDTYSDLYASAYQNISEQQTAIKNIGQPSTSSLFDAAFLAVGALFTTAIIGISSIATIASSLPIVFQTIIQSIQIGPPIISTIVFGFITAAGVIYIVMRALGSARGQTEP